MLQLFRSRPNKEAMVIKTVIYALAYYDLVEYVPSRCISVFGIAFICPADTVCCLATGWTTGRLRFDPRQRRKNIFCSLCVQTGSGAHPASCTMGTGGPFLGVKRGRGVTLTSHPHLVPRSRMSRSYTFSPPSTCVACRGTAFRHCVLLTCTTLDSNSYSHAVR
jgi:hypothetical protein